MKFKCLFLILPLVGLLLFINSYGQNKSYLPANKTNKSIAEWEKLRFGAFVHFNDNTFIEQEISKNANPQVFAPEKIDFDSMMSTFQKAGIKYAVLTARHTSGFCLWDSQSTGFDVANSPYKKDVVRQFVESCRSHGIKPCLYYCMWGGKDWNPTAWNPVIKEELKGMRAKNIILAQLSELAENYGEIYEFWLDMQCWADTSPTVQESYDLLKAKNPGTFVHFNQHIQDGSELRYFPTDFMNGEERIPPASGHKPIKVVDKTSYYLPFEYEIPSQCCLHRSMNYGLMKGSVWFTFTDSGFYPTDSLYHYIKQSLDRGGSNILLSTAPDKTGVYRKADCDSIIKLGQLLFKH